MSEWWSWLLTAVGAFGLYLAGRKIWWAWGVGIGAQVLWFTYAVTTEQWGFVASCLVYGWVYVKNLLAWRAERNEDDETSLNLRGIPTHVCICGCDTFKILARFEEGRIVWYTTAGYCYGCGAAVTVPTEADEETPWAG